MTHDNGYFFLENSHEYTDRDGVRHEKPFSISVILDDAKEDKVGPYLAQKKSKVLVEGPLCHVRDEKIGYYHFMTAVRLEFLED